VFETTDQLFDLSSADVGPRNEEGRVGAQSPLLPKKPQSGLVFIAVEKFYGSAEQSTKAEDSIRLVGLQMAFLPPPVESSWRDLNRTGKIFQGQLQMLTETLGSIEIESFEHLVHDCLKRSRS
jgi:hypothetical protein